MHHRSLAFAREFPDADVRVLIILAQRLVVFGLAFLSEMAAAGFLPLESIADHEFCKLQEIGNPAGPFKRLVDVFGSTRHVDRTPEFVTYLRQLFKGAFERIWRYVGIGTTAEFDFDALVGAAQPTIITAAGPYTVPDEVVFPVIDQTTPAPITVTWNATREFPLIVKDGKGDANANKITLDPPAATTLDGQASVDIDWPYGAYKIVKRPDTGNWITVP